MQSVQLPTRSAVCTLDMLCQEAEACIARGQVKKAQPISILGDYLPRREWNRFALVLEEHGFVLQDRIQELLPQNRWQND